MSENKYIIDKDSLTGIADAVRDKLGVGEATTDPQTGDIVYPEGKGYYIGVENIDHIAVSDYQTIFSTGSHTKDLIRCSKTVYVGKAEKSFSQIEIEGYFYWYSMTCSLTANTHSLPLENSSTTLQKITETFDTPQSYFAITLNITNKYNTSQNFYFKDVKILLKDENGDPIKLISSGFPASYGGTTCTIETVTQEVQKPIPYSVVDIKNNIEDYWNIPAGSLDISANGTYDVTTKASAIVNVPNPSTGSLTINANGTYDVTEKASAIVSVSPSLQTKTTTISQNGSQIITPDSNYDGLSAVNLTINVPNPSTGSLEITENGTYDVTDKASAVVNVPSSGGLPPFTVPTVKTKAPRWDTPEWSDFSSIFSTQEEMLEHLIDIIPARGAYAGEIAGEWLSAPVFKDKYGRWIPLKMMGVTLPSSFSIGSSWASLGLTGTVIQNLYNDNLVFGCSSVTNYVTQGGFWYIIFNRYIVGCSREFVGLNSNYSYVLYTEA